MEWSRQRRIYPAVFLRVRDGDTFWFLADTGLHSRQEWPFRLKDYDVVEKSSPLGPSSITWAIGWFTEHAQHSKSRFPFYLFTMADSSTSEFERLTFDRFVAEFECGEGHSYGAMVYAAGFVK